MFVQIAQHHNNVFFIINLYNGTSIKKHKGARNSTYILLIYLIMKRQNALHLN